MARPTQTLREAVREALGGVSRQALDQRVERLKKRLPMTPDDAVAVIGHEQGVDISRWLDADSLARASGYVGQLKAQATASTKPALRPGASKPVYVNVGDGPDVDPLPGMTAAHAREARKMAREVYPLLYVFENSARDVIARVLTAAIGPDWWPRVVPSKVQERAAIRMTAEGREAWHSRRGAAPIQYVDLEDLAKIVRDGRIWPHFKDLFPRANWFDSVIDDMNVSRRVVAHMNPLAGDDIKSVEQGFRKWRKQLQAKADLLA